LLLLFLSLFHFLTSGGDPVSDFTILRGAILSSLEVSSLLNFLQVAKHKALESFSLSLQVKYLQLRIKFLRKRSISIAWPISTSVHHHQLVRGRLPSAVPSIQL